MDILLVYIFILSFCLDRLSHRHLLLVYEISLSIKRNLNRLVHTSPIKALSNKKFRDFSYTTVMYTTKRPVPLEHYLYTGCDGKTINEKFLLIDSRGKLTEENYRKAMAAKKERESKYHKSFGAINKSSMGSDKIVRNTYITVIRHLAKDQLPVIIFTFSRRRCDQYARMLASPLDLPTAEEKGRIQRFIHRSLLRILPLLKEITEILFTEGLVRALFATNFSMGINMRIVIFDSIQKHDGKVFRRRGKDKTGNVLILCIGDITEMSILAWMTVEKATELQSQSRLTYSMILNNSRVREHIGIEKYENIWELGRPNIKNIRQNL
uniref:Helicase C-terminal domain-containing protein n=1 Tax=Tetranychus urticae TaxID=32264 RepID=T1JU04_TETUR